MRTGPNINPAPLASLVVATVDRVAEPDALLRSLAALPGRDFELILADQNSDERLAPLVERYSLSFPIRHLRLAERNADAARNAGAAVAAGRWVGFPDDDCRYRADTLDVFRRLAADTKLRLICGNVLDDEGRALIGGGRAPAQLNPVNVWGRIAEPCLFIERTRFGELGGFSREFGPGGRYPTCEGLELALRFLSLSRRGEGLYDPALVTLHPRKWAPGEANSGPRAFEHGIGLGAVAAIHPRPAALAHFGWHITKSLAATAWAPARARAARFEQCRGLLAGFARAAKARLG